MFCNDYIAASMGSFEGEKSFRESQLVCYLEFKLRYLKKFEPIVGGQRNGLCVKLHT